MVSAGFFKTFDTSIAIFNLSDLKEADKRSDKARPLDSSVIY